MQSLVFSQTSGEAQYASDIPTQGGELYAAFVVTTQVWYIVLIESKQKVYRLDFCLFVLFLET